LLVLRHFAEAWSFHSEFSRADNFIFRHVLAKDLGSLDAVRANRPKGLPTVEIFIAGVWGWVAGPRQVIFEKSGCHPNRTAVYSKRDPLSRLLSD
jgi:hypothetical protein